jgi:hypothetical protein
LPHFFSVFFLNTNAVFAASGTDNLEGYWKLDETSANGGGDSVIDSSGDAAHGTPAGSGGANNTPQPSEDVPTSMGFADTRSLDFDGTDDSVAIDDPSVTNVISISFWARTDDTATVGFKHIVSEHPGWFISGDGATPSNIRCGINTGSETSVTFDTATNIGTGWHHYICVYNGSNVTTYLDGTQKNQTSKTGNIDTSGSAMIGSYAGSINSTYSWDGKIDDVRIYNRALISSEITALANKTHTSATWDGSSSTNPETAANWDINAVPDPYSLLTIADVTNQPTATANIGMAGLTINSGAWFDLSTYNLTMNDSGAFSNSGTLRLKNSQTITGFTNDTDSGTILINPTGDTTGLKTGNSYYNLVLNDSLVGYWKLDDTSSGGNIVDSSGYDNHGTADGAAGSNYKPQPNNSVTSESTFINTGSFDFDGNDDEVAASDQNNIFDLGTEFTLSTWVYVDNHDASYAFLISRDGSGGNESYDLGFKAGIPYVAINDGSSWGEYVADNVLDTDSWHHIGAVRASDNTLKIYVDGTNVKEFTSVKTPANTGVDLTLGKRDEASLVYDGYIDDARVYSKPLSSDNMSLLGNGSIPLQGTTTTTLNANLDINNDLILNSGTLDVDPTNNYGITVGGDFENNGGVFTARSGTLTLDGGNQSINSSNTFYNLTKSVSTARTLTFGQRSTTTITNTATLNGAASNLLTLASSTGGTQFNINPSATRNFSYLSVSDSNNTNATAIAYSSTINYGDNLTNWTNIGPTTTPTPTSTPITSSSSESSTSSTGTAPSCNDQTPQGKPDLFQIDTTTNQATLHFTPVSGISKYYLSYSTNPSAEQHGTEVSLGTEGVQSFTINLLSSETTYYFKVRGQNGCAPGDWSGIKPATTKARSGGIGSFVVLMNERTKKAVEESLDSAAEKAANIPIVEKAVDKKIEITKIETKPKVNIVSYIVKAGDTLWNISKEILGTSTEYAKIIKQNIKKYPDMLANLSIGSKLDIVKEEQPDVDNNTNSKLYDLDVKILASNNTPLEGVKVTLHSTSRTEVTNKDGVAHFNKVEGGEHKVYLAYEGYDGGGQSINVTGDNKDIELVMQVELDASFSNPAVIAVIAALTMIIGILALILFRKRFKQQKN